MSTPNKNIIKSLNISLSSELSSKTDADTDFGERIRTYITDQKWVKKPLVLSPAVCSQYGWKCVRSNLLECVTCSAKLSTHEPSIEVYDAYRDCINKILQDLKHSHKKHCPWSLNPSPDSFVKMIPVPREEALHYFMKRLKPCLNFESSLPLIKESTFSDLGLDEKHVSSFCKIADISADDADRFGRSVVSLAATGWTMTCEESKSNQTFITCRSCQRFAYPHSFSSVKLSNNEDEEKICEQSSSSINGVADADEPPHKKLKISSKEKKLFDPLHEHRPWCLWILPHSSKNNSLEETVESEDEMSSMPGWKIFIKSLLRNICESDCVDIEDSPSKERLRSVRNMLATWADVTT